MGIETNGMSKLPVLFKCILYAHLKLHLMENTDLLSILEDCSLLIGWPDLCAIYRRLRNSPNSELPIVAWSNYHINLPVSALACVSELLPNP
ncbi:hypothetical protein AVEN_47745-1 [Araneus ventricosus]|uniref:Uncharacterized protein n=1 Tax=Araneus ventricosus TaxID=182803 RepID=A0A4Y2BMJ8_ARAVE|nr:hypothetical protein AVEN_47745-1 [Araneus ventricosus]